MAVAPEAVGGAPVTSVQGSNSTSFTFDLPDGSHLAGRRLIAIVVKDGNGSISWPGESWKTPGGSGANGVDGDNLNYMSVRYLDTTGEEGFSKTGATVTVTGANEEWQAWVVLLEKGTFNAGSAPEMAAATGGSGNANPPNLTPSWGTDAVAWIAGCVVDSATGQSGPSSFPTNYTSWQYGAVSSSGSGSVIFGVGARLLESDSSDDPSNFVNRSDGWRAVTIGVRGGEGAEPPSESQVPGYKDSRYSGYELEGESMTIAPPEGAVKGGGLYAGFIVSGSAAHNFTAPPGWKKVAVGVGPQSTETVGFYYLQEWDGVETAFNFGWGGGTEFYQWGIVAYDAPMTLNAVGTLSHVNGEEKDPVPVNGLTTTDPAILTAMTFNGNGYFGEPVDEGWTERGDQLLGPHTMTKDAAGPGKQAATECNLNNPAEWVSLMVAFGECQPQVRLESGTTETGIGGGESLTVSAPGSREVDDFLLGIGWLEGISKTPSVDEGFRSLGSAKHSSAAPHLYAQARRATDQAIDNWTTSWSGSIERFGEMRRFSGATRFPENVQIGDYATPISNGETITVPGMTAEKNGSLAVIIYDTWSPSENPAPEGWTLDEGGGWCPILYRPIDAGEETGDVDIDFDEPEYAVAWMIIIPPETSDVLLAENFEEWPLAGDFYENGEGIAEDTGGVDGGLSAKCETGAKNVVEVEVNPWSALGKPLYYRMAFKTDDPEPSSNIDVMNFWATDHTPADVYLNSSGEITWWNSVTAEMIANTGVEPEANKWYWLEMMVNIAAAGNSTLQLRIYDELGDLLYDSGEKSQGVGNKKIAYYAGGNNQNESATIWVDGLAVSTSWLGPYAPTRIGGVVQEYGVRDLFVLTKEEIEAAGGRRGDLIALFPWWEQEPGLVYYGADPSAIVPGEPEVNDGENYGFAALWVIWDGVQGIAIEREGGKLFGSVLVADIIRSFNEETPIDSVGEWNLFGTPSEKVSSHEIAGLTTKTDGTRQWIAMVSADGTNQYPTAGGWDEGTIYSPFTFTRVRPETGTSSATAITIEGTSWGASVSFAIRAPNAEAEEEEEPITKTLTPATETDSAEALSYVKPIVKSLTAATESDTAGALDYSKPIKKTLTPATEADSAGTLGVNKPILVSLSAATETDAAGTLSWIKPKVVALDAATETDSAGALAYIKPIVKSLIPAEETDSAGELTFIQPIAVSLTPATETDTAGELGFNKPIVVSLTPATEADTAGTLSYNKPLAVSVEPAGESDSAGTLTPAKIVAVEPATETDSAGQLKLVGYEKLTPATETDSAGELGIVKRVALSPAEETDTAGTLKTVGYEKLQPAEETDTAGELAVRKRAAIDPATETDSATAQAAIKRVSLTPATETDTALALSFVKPIIKSLTAATETDTAKVLKLVGYEKLEAATEVDTAGELSVVKRLALTPATETSTAFSLAAVRRVAIEPATETDTAGSLSWIKPLRVSIDPAEETDSAGALAYRVNFRLTPAVETSSAGVLGIRKVTKASPAVESDNPGTLTLRKRGSLFPASESASAGTLVICKRRAVAPAVETDTAGELSWTRLVIQITISPAVEADEAGTLGWHRIWTLDPAEETDTAHGLEPRTYQLPGRGGVGVVAEKGGGHATVTQTGGRATVSRPTSKKGSGEAARAGVGVLPNRNE